MSSKRGRSGTRPSGGSAKTKIAPHARHIYEIAFRNSDGSLIGPEDPEYDRKLSEFKLHCPELAAKIAEGAPEQGLVPGTWEHACWTILDGLLRRKNQEAKWFLEPVDPVKHHVPDYFNVIKNPMDLGQRRPPASAELRLPPSRRPPSARTLHTCALIVAPWQAR